MGKCQFLRFRTECAIFRQINNQTETLLIRSTKGTNWKIPGGAIKRKEHKLSAGVRETMEEAGVFGELEAKGKLTEYFDFKNKE